MRVLIADDHAVVREGLKRLIEQQPDMQVVGETSDGNEAVELTVSLSPDIVVLDVSLTTVGGPQVARELKQRCPNVKILALSVHEDRSCIHEMLDAGAAGYVLKRAGSDELVTAIRAVAARGMYVDPRVAGKLIAAFGGRRPAAGDAKVQLSERETEVMRMIAQGFTNKEISAQLGLSVKTVETYKARSMDKLGLRSRVDIVRLATDRGWLTAR